MIDWYANNEEKKYTTDDWVDPENAKDSYQKSKILAEKFALEFVNQLKEEEKFELITILPAFIIGPPLLKSESPSITIFVDMLNRKYPFVPDLFFICCDV